MNRNFKYSNGSRAPRKFEKTGSFTQQVILLVSEDFGACVVSHINYITLYVDQQREGYSTQKAQHETVANIQDTRVLNLCSNDHVRRCIKKFLDFLPQTANRWH
jgi:hypothetical protein